MTSAYFRQDFLSTPDGASLYYQVHGAGQPAAVLCDGIGCDGFAWKYLLPELRQEHRVLRWHYRGHGQSTLAPDGDRIGLGTSCNDLAQLMDANALEHAVIFGHSMGVQVALEFHRQYRDRVLGLVLVCGSYGNPLDTIHDLPLLRRGLPLLRRLVEHFPREVARFTQFALKTELVLQMTLSLELNRELLKRDDLVPYFDHLAKMDPVVFMKTLDSLAEHTAWPHLTQVDVPTLIIAGGRDRFTPMWLSQRMADNIPGAEMMVLPQGSHTATLEQPGPIWARAQRFLREQIAPRIKERKEASG